MNELNWVRPEKRCFADMTGAFHLTCAVIRTGADYDHPDPSPAARRRRGRFRRWRGYRRRPDQAMAPTFARWIARSRQRRALRDIAERTDDHLLKDMGVLRQEALREADKPFWRP